VAALVGEGLAQSTSGSHAARGGSGPKFSGSRTAMTRPVSKSFTTTGAGRGRLPRPANRPGSRADAARTSSTRAAAYRTVAAATKSARDGAVRTADYPRRRVRRRAADEPRRGPALPRAWCRARLADRRAGTSGRAASHRSAAAQDCAGPSTGLAGPPSRRSPAQQSR
jgi:hypothetical protein